MIQVNVHEAKTHLSRLLKRIMMGEEVLIAKAGKPLAKLVPYGETKSNRIPGLDRGLFDVPEDSDSVLPEQIMQEFER